MTEAEANDDLRRRIEAGAKWNPGLNERLIPPRVSVLARFIRETWPELSVTLRPWETNTDRPAGRLRIPGKGRKGKLLEVRDPRLKKPNDFEAPLIYRHETSQTYKHNGNVCEWIVKRLKEEKK